MKTVAALVLASATAYAEPAAHTGATYSIDIGSHERWFGDTSGAIISEDTLSGLRMTIGRSLTRTDVRDRDLDLGLYARWVYATTAGTMFGDLDTSFHQHLLGGGLRADTPLRRWFSISAQGELGMARSSLTVTRDEMTPVDDHGWAPYAAASLGAELTLLRGKRLTASLGLDVGYLVTVPVELHALPGDRPDEDLSIATEFAGIGKIDSRGWMYSMSLRASF
jgi:hypothetical protein